MYGKERIRVFIEQLNQVQGTTVILTTHDIADVERLCRRVVLIDHGRVLYDGDLQSLKARYAPYRELRVRVNDGGPDMASIVVPGAKCFVESRRDMLALRSRTTGRPSDGGGIGPLRGVRHFHHRA